MGLVLLVPLLALSVSAADFYVSPNGTTDTGPGTGTLGNPWSLQTALWQPSSVHASDTIWLRGGTYVGTFQSNLTGTQVAPIQVRQYPGERATLDGNAVTTLAVAMDASTRTCTLAAGLYAPDPMDRGAGVVRIDSEDIHLFLKSGPNTYTSIDRGWNGTTPAAHNAGARVTTSTVTLGIYGAYTWYVGFEIMNSSGLRTNSVAGSLPPNGLGFAIDDYGPGTRIIDMVVHDAGQGIGLWSPATDSEVYGNLIYYNGWDAPDRGHGHGIYTQNQTPSIHRIADNILLDGFAIGVQAYTEGGHIDNIDLLGNTAFGNGALSRVSGYTYNLLIGGQQLANNPSMISNFTYTPHAAGGNNNLGYSAGCTNGTVTGNYFAASTALKLVNCSSGLSMTGNTFYGSLDGFTSGQYPGNTYYSSRPTGTQIFIRPNQYEAGRANITVYNWDLNASILVDLSSVLTISSQYEIRNAQNFYGPPVVSGTYAGGAIALPQTGMTPATPVGWTAPPVTGPEFNAFVVLSTGIGPPPPPVASFTFSPSNPETNVSVQFTDTSTGGPTSWQWDFGDGGASLLQNPSYVFAVEGTYTVYLQAANDGGSSRATRSVTVTAPAMPPTPTRFYTLAPCRLIDTRNADGPTGGPTLAATSARTFPVAAGCGVPSDARAVSGNVIAVSPAASGFVTVYPGNLSVPLATVINFRASQTRANNAVVALATDGTGTIRVWNGSAGTVDFVFDVNGYFR